MSSAATKLRQLLDANGSKLVSVVFEKANGEQRQMTINPRQIGEIKGTGRVNTDPDLFRVVDHRLGQWRSFHASRVVSVKVQGQLEVF